MVSNSLGNVKTKTCLKYLFLQDHLLLGTLAKKMVSAQQLEPSAAVTVNVHQDKALILLETAVVHKDLHLNCYLH